MKKKLVLSLAAAAMVGTLAVGGTLAWFTDTETAVNVVTTGNVDIAWYEGAENTDDSLEKITKDHTGIQFGETTPVVPGQNLDKVAIIKNEGKNPAYIRAKIEFKEVAEDGTETVVDDLTNLFDTVGLDSKWSFENGYYYYEAVLVAKTGVTSPIMTDVTVSDKANNETLKDKTYRIYLNAEAIQSDNLGEGVASCKDAFGKIDNEHSMLDLETTAAQP